jgi:hypothetical protein
LPLPIAEAKERKEKIMSNIEMLQAELVRLEGWIQAAGRSVWPASFVQEWADRADDIRLELNHLEDLAAELAADEAAAE